MNSSQNYLKFTMIGDGAVGKTCIVMAYTTKKFPKEYVPTVIDTKTFNVKFNDKLFNLDIYDTAGQEDYEKLRLLAYPQTDVFLVCFSVVNHESFTNIRYVF